MTFLQPWAVWFLAGIPVIVLLYLLRLKRQEITVSTHLFWQRVLQESSRRAFFRRLRHLWSLLLQILIFLLIATALAKPLWKQGEVKGDRIVLVLDTRARMQAIEPDGQTRFAKAVATARDYARQANVRSQMALLTLADSAQVVVPFTDDESILIKALDQARPTDAAGDAETSLALAEAILTGRPGDARIVLFTDRPLSNATASAHPKATVHAFGSPLDNVAITRFASRPHPASPETVELLLEVRNFGKTPAKTDVEIALDGRVFEVRPFQVDPDQSRLEILSTVPRPGRGSLGWLTARIKTSDALASDNVAYAGHPARPPRRVLLVSEGNPFLEKLLAADPGTRFQFIEPSAWKPELAAKFEAVIFDRFVPSDFRWSAAAGSYLVIGKDPFGNTTGPALERPLVTEVSDSDPATRGLRLQNVAIQKALSLEIPPSTDGWKFRAPLRSFEHPLLLLGKREAQRIAVLSFDVLESDLPLRVGFPLLFSQILQELDSRPLDLAQQAEAGKTVALQPGEQVAATPLLAPAKNLPPIQESAFFHPLQNGYYRIGPGEVPRWLAVNTFSATESDLRVPAAPPKTPANFQSPGTPMGPWPLWTWFTLGALALFTGEWWLFHRRKTE